MQSRKMVIRYRTRLIVLLISKARESANVPGKSKEAG